MTIHNYNHVARLSDTLAIGIAKFENPAGTITSRIIRYLNNSCTAFVSPPSLHNVLSYIMGSLLLSGPRAF